MGQPDSSAVARVLAAVDHFDVLEVKPCSYACTTDEERFRRVELRQHFGCVIMLLAVAKNRRLTHTICVLQVQLRLVKQQDLLSSRNQVLLQVHPDKHGADVSAKEATVRVNDALDMVGDTGRRTEYIEHLRQQLMEGIARREALATTAVFAKSSAVDSTASAPAQESDKEVLKAQAREKSRVFARLLDTYVADFASCTNAKQRTPVLKAHGVPVKGSILDMRSTLLMRLCHGMSPACEEALSGASASSSSSSSNGSSVEAHIPKVSSPADAKGIDILGTLFTTATLPKESHPFVPLYVHPCCFQAVKSMGARHCTYGLLLGVKHQSTYRVQNIVVTAEAEKLTLFLQQHMQGQGEQLVLGYFLATPD